MFSCGRCALRDGLNFMACAAHSITNHLKLEHCFLQRPAAGRSGQISYSASGMGSSAPSCIRVNCSITWTLRTMWMRLPSRAACIARKSPSIVLNSMMPPAALFDEPAAPSQPPGTRENSLSYRVYRAQAARLYPCSGTGIAIFPGVTAWKPGFLASSPTPCRLTIALFPPPHRNPHDPTQPA